MIKAKRKKAAAGTATPKRIIRQNKSYRKGQVTSTENHRAERIRKHRSDIPKVHRKTYDRAMQGKSLKSAVKAFCLECACWQKEEIRLCTSLVCPLYPYRPYKEKSKQASEGLSFGAESKSSGKGNNYAG
jgi:hypothetical protein